MITRANRIPRTLFPHNKRPTFVVHTPLLRVALYKNNTVLPARIAIVISKKEISSAVERNALRRKLYHGVAPLLAELQGFYVVITPRKELKKLKSKEIISTLKEPLSRVFQKSA